MDKRNNKKPSFKSMHRTVMDEPPVSHEHITDEQIDLLFTNIDINLTRLLGHMSPTSKQAYYYGRDAQSLLELMRRRYFNARKANKSE